MSDQNPHPGDTHHSQSPVGFPTPPPPPSISHCTCLYLMRATKTLTCAAASKLLEVNGK